MTELLFPNQLVDSPLHAALAARCLAPDVRLSVVPDDEAAWRLRENECDAALVGPLTYALIEGEASLVPGIAVSSVGPTRETMLVFRSGLERITTLAVPPDHPLDAMLAQIILREKYDMHPRVSTVPLPWREALGSFDAVLVTGEAAAALAPDSASIDLVDEWFDMVQLPFVRAVVGGWNHRLSSEFVRALDQAAHDADREALAGLVIGQDGRLVADDMHLIPGHHRYLLDEEARDGLDAFFRLAFFFGLHRDIPNLVTWSEELDAADADAADADAADADAADAGASDAGGWEGHEHAGRNDAAEAVEGDD